MIYPWSRHILIWISTRGPGLDSERDGSETDGDPVGMERKNGRDIVKDTIGNDETLHQGDKNYGERYYYSRMNSRQKYI